MNVKHYDAKMKTSSLGFRCFYSVFPKVKPEPQRCDYRGLAY
jgi:hypothetical protein